MWWNWQLQFWYFIVGPCSLENGSSFHITNTMKWLEWWMGSKRGEETKGVFVWRWNKVNKKLWKKNRKINFFRVCLVEWGERKINCGPMCFLSVPIKKFSPKNWEKTRRENELPKIPLNSPPSLQCVGFFFVVVVVFFFFFWFFLSLLLTCWLPLYFFLCFCLEVLAFFFFLDM